MIIFERSILRAWWCPTKDVGSGRSAPRAAGEAKGAHRSRLFAQLLPAPFLFVWVSLGLLAGSTVPAIGWAQDSTQVRAEGRALHHATGQIYFFEVKADSTIYIRQEKPPAPDASLTLPLQTFNAIRDHATQQLDLFQAVEEGVEIGYKDSNLVLHFTQQFNLYILGALIVVSGVGGGLLFWLWYRLSRERRRREALAQSRRYLAQGREKERERLAQEIHDGPVQDLHGLHMQLKAVSGSSDDDPLDTMEDELMRVTSELRAMSADLHPPALQRFGLAAALRSHADRLRDRSPSLQIDMELTDRTLSLPDEFALPLFRIAQEAMNNAVQHGHASHVQVHLRKPDETVELKVEDDGDGFSPPDDWHALAEQGHYGLLGMRERADAIGAALDIASTPEAGTRVLLQAPVSSPSDEPSSHDASVPA